MRTGAEVVGLRLEGARVRAVDYRVDGETRSAECRAAISTLPLPVVARLCRPSWPEEVLRAAEALEHRPLVFVGLLVRRSPVLPTSLLYLREALFNRVSDLALLGFDPPDPGCDILVAEMTCDPADPLWSDDQLAIRTVVDGLARSGFLDPTEVADSVCYREPHAYPVWRLGFERHLDRVLSHVSSSPNFETAGRQGRFQYVNIHVAMRMGEEAVDRLAARGALPSAPSGAPPGG